MIWKRFNRNLANVGRGREEIRGTRDSRFRAAAENFSPRHAVSTRLCIAAVPPTASRNNSGNTPWQRLRRARDLSSPFHVYVYTCNVYTRTRDLLRVAGSEMAKRGEEGSRSRGEETWLDAGRLESRPFCDMLIFNDPRRNSLRSTYLLNGDV